MAPEMRYFDDIVRHVDGSGEESAARSNLVRFVCSSGSLS